MTLSVGEWEGVREAHAGSQRRVEARRRAGGEVVPSAGPRVVQMIWNRGGDLAWGGLSLVRAGSREEGSKIDSGLLVAVRIACVGFLRRHSKHHQS